MRLYVLDSIPMPPNAMRGIGAAHVRFVKVAKVAAEAVFRKNRRCIKRLQFSRMQEKNRAAQWNELPRILGVYL
jgi:hypothetical protein